MKQNQCENCIYFKPAEASQPPGNGFCRLNPPAVVHVAGPAKGHEVTCAQPVVQFDNWCGQHKINTDKLPPGPRPGQEFAEME